MTTSLTAIAVAAVLVFATTGQYAFGDNVVNDVAANPGSDTFVSGGSTTVGYKIIATGAGPNPQDGQSGCNAADSSSALVTINAPSGITASPGSLTFTTCGTFQNVIFSSSTPGDYSITVTVSDNGAGTYSTIPATFTLHVTSPPPPSDTTGPVITYTLNPSAPDGAHGWYKSNVDVTWSVSDPDSAVTIDSGCVDTTLSTDNSGIVYGCTAHSSGGFTTVSTSTIKRDATAPTISGSASPSPNADGWNNGDVTVTFTCGDALSGVDTCVVTPQTLNSDGASQSASATATDNAGNTATATVSGINIDKTAPDISGSASPAANGYGWNNGPVSVTFTCADGLSDIKSCTSPITLSTDGAGQTATGTAVDKADNSASITVSGINIDTAMPTISGSASPVPNGNGWNNVDVTVTFTCADALSGIASCGQTPQTLSSEGAGQSATGTATDKAGNSDTATVSGINIDKTAPSVSLVGGPAGSALYYFGSVPAAPTCSASDGLSGLDGACTVTGYSTALGSHTVTATAKDKAGNTNTDSHTYTVLAWTISGFYQPTDMGGVLNTVKNGATVPLKFEVFQGAPVSSPVIAPNELTSTSIVTSFSVKKIICDTTSAIDDIEMTTTGGTVLRYDTTAGQFVQNWQTPKTAGQCYQVTLTTNDGSSIAALFKLK